MTRKKPAKKRARKKVVKKKPMMEKVKKKAKKKKAERSRRTAFCPGCGHKLRPNGTCGLRDCPCYGKTPAACIKF